jgi:hypothetical protein
VRIGQDQGVLPQDQTAAPAPPEISLEERRAVSPTPEQAAANLLSSASQGGRKDSLGNMLLEASVQGAGPLSGLFAGLGAALAGKDPDFAAAAAQEGFRQIEADRMAKEQLAMQKQLQQFNMRSQTIRLGLAAGLSSKALKESVRGLAFDLGIPMDEVQTDTVLKVPGLYNLTLGAAAGRTPTIEDAKTYYTARQEMGLPDDDPLVAAADQQLNDMIFPKKDTTPASERFTRASAVGTIKQQLVDSGYPEDVAQEIADARIPQSASGEVTATFLAQAQQRLPDLDQPLGREFGGVLAAGAGLPEEYGGVLSRLTPQDAVRVSSEIRNWADVPQEQILPKLVTQVVDDGKPLTAGQYAVLNMEYMKRAGSALNAVSGISDQIFLLSEDPESAGDAELLKQSRAVLMQALAFIPDVMGLSDELSLTPASLDDLINLDFDPFSAQGVLNLAE